MKMIKDKQLLVAADFAGYPLKEAVVAHLKSKGWHITDIGVRSLEDDDPELMFHRLGLRAGSMVSEGEFERALLFCGTGMGIHIDAPISPEIGLIYVVFLNAAFFRDIDRQHFSSSPTHAHSPSTIKYYDFTKDYK